MLRVTHYPLNLWAFNTLFFSETVPVSGSYCHTCKLHVSLLIRGQIPIPLRASSTPFVVPPSIQHTITKAGLISSAENSNCLILVLWVSLWWNNSKLATLQKVGRTPQQLIGKRKQSTCSSHLLCFSILCFITWSFPDISYDEANGLLKEWVIPVSQYWAHDLSTRPFKLTRKRCKICFKFFYGSGTSLSLSQRSHNHHIQINISQMLCSWPPGPKIYTHRRNQLLAIVAPVSEGEWLHLSGNLKNPWLLFFNWSGLNISVRVKALRHFSFIVSKFVYTFVYSCKSLVKICVLTFSKELQLFERCK